MFVRILCRIDGDLADCEGLDAMNALNRFCQIRRQCHRCGSTESLRIKGPPQACCQMNHVSPLIVAALVARFSLGGDLKQPGMVYT